MIIEDNFISLNSINRPGSKLKSIRGLVVHYVGVDQKSALVIRNNMERSSRYGSTQYICDYNTGNILRIMPENELAYHVGANTYKSLKARICGNDNPNFYLVGIETCIESVANSRPSDVQWKALIEFSADFLKRHKLGVEDIYLHNDIASTQCYKYFIDNPAEWQSFKNDVQNKLTPQIKEELNKEMYEEIMKEIRTIKDRLDKLDNTPIKTVLQAKYTTGRYRVNSLIGLNVRAGAGTNHKINTKYTNNTVFDVFEVNGVWGRTPSGWVSLDYCVKI